jgi:type II secretory pathway component PulM
MSTAIDEIRALLTHMQSRSQEVTKVESLLAEVSQALSDIVTLMGQPDEDDDQVLADAILEGLRGLSIKAPDVHVSVPAAPDVHVTVQAPSVTVQAPANPLAGWTLRVTSRDELGQIQTVSLKPEN